MTIINMLSKKIRQRFVWLFVAAFALSIYYSVSARLAQHDNAYHTKDHQRSLRPRLPIDLIRNDQRKKSHTFYVHYLDSKDQNSVQNFLFFVQFAYSPCNPRMFFTFVLNTDREMMNVTEPLVHLLGHDVVFNMIKCESNTQITARINKPGGDLCAHVEQMQSTKWMTTEERKYDYYFFINSSVRGPFIPAYYLKEWWDMFLDMFEKYPRAAAVGPYLSCEFNPHLQSFVVAVDKRGLTILKDVWRCPRQNERRIEWIIDSETKLGPAIIKEGYEMRSFIQKYQKNDSISTRCYPKNPTFRYPVTQQEKMSIYGVPETPDVSVNVHEVVWIKYGGNIDYHQYVIDYVPLYTHLAYQNLE